MNGFYRRRLPQSEYHDEFVLKGALRMVAWPGGLTRSTADIDFRGYVGTSSDELASVVEEICRVPVPPDAVEFDPSSVQVEQIVERGDSSGARVRFWGYVGKARIRVQLDVSFSDVSTPGNEVVDYPTILDMPAPRLRAYPKETVVAEKLEAIVWLGELNSRMKDFYDLFHMSRTFTFEGRMLAQAIANTFSSRGTPIPSLPPVGLRDEFATKNEGPWGAFLNRIADSQASLFSLTGVISHLRTFLLPPRQAAGDGQEFSRIWVEDGGWR